MKNHQQLTLLLLALMCGTALYAYIYGITSTKSNAEAPTEALNAFDFEAVMRAYPNAQVPVGAFTQAHKYYQQHFAAQRDSSNAQWQNIGPNNIPGRSIAIAINPTDTNVVWMGSAAGGLWKSETGGLGDNAWQAVPIGYPVLGVSSIAINPQNPNEMLIGTGEQYNYTAANGGIYIRTLRGSYGMGIFKSVDGGQTWQPSLDWSYQQNTGIWDIVFDPQTPTNIYAATTQGVYKTTDSGNTWQQVLNKAMVMDLEIDRLNPNRVYAAVGAVDAPEHGIYRTTNGGANWAGLSVGLPTNGTYNGRISITSYYNNPQILMAGIGDDFATIGLYRSTNGGDTWQQMSGSAPDVLDYQGWYAKCLHLKNNDSSKVLFGGVELFKSTQGGSNLVQKSPSYEGNITFLTFHSDIHGIVANPLAPNKVYIITDGGLYRSNDFGETFIRCHKGYSTGQFYVVSPSYTNANKAIGGLQDNNSAIWTGDNNNWQFTHYGDGTYNAINYNNDNTMFCSSQYMYLTKSDNSGTDWFNSLNLDLGNVCFAAPFAMAPNNQDVLYAGGEYLAQSTDNGNSWAINGNSVTNGEAILAMDIANNEQIVYFSTTPSEDGTQPAQLFKTLDGGTAFSNITQDLPNRYIRDIAIHPTDYNTAYVVLAGFGTPHVFKTKDGGATWDNISAALPDLPVHTVLIDPLNPQDVYIGTDFNIFVSSNGGETWSNYSDGLPDAVQVYDLKVSPADRKLIIATHGRGMYKGNFLHQFVTNLNPLSNLQTLAIYPNPASNYFVVPANLEGKISVVDMAGKVCIEQLVSSQSNKIGIQRLQTGTYMVLLDTPKGKFVAKLLKL